MTRFGKVDGSLCLHFTPSFLIRMLLCGPCRMPQPSLNTVRSSAQLHLQNGATTLREDTQGDVSSSGFPSAAVTAASCETIQQSTHRKFRSVSPGSQHTLARAVCQSPAKRRFHLETKHLAQLGSGGWGVGRGQLACTEGTLGILYHPQPECQQWSGGLSQVAPGYFGASPVSIPRVHVHSSLTVGSIPCNYRQLAPCLSKGYIIHVLAVCFVSTRGLLAALAEALGS